MGKWVNGKWANVQRRKWNLKPELTKKAGIILKFSKTPKGSDVYSQQPSPLYDPDGVEPNELIHLLYKHVIPSGLKYSPIIWLVVGVFTDHPDRLERPNPGLPSSWYEFPLSHLLSSGW
jgi:hypothetical protein